MRVLGVLLLLGAFAALGVFIWPLVQGGRGAKGPTATPRSRAEVVRGQSQGPRPEPVTRPAAREPPPEPRGPLCDRSFDAKSAPMFEGPLGRTLRAGPPAASVPGWTWLNLWAAWCGPCKEEMPLLDAFSKRTGMRLVLASVDDDERQVRRFLAGEGQKLQGAVVWMDEATRGVLYAALRVENPPRLPVQALIDPSGRLRCLREGAIDPADLQEVERTWLRK